MSHEDTVKNLLEELKFVSKDKERARWFKNPFFIGFTKKGSKVCITKKAKSYEKDKSVNVQYIGSYHNAQWFHELLLNIGIIKNETIKPHTESTQ